jgi:hypothetical protein
VAVVSAGVVNDPVVLLPPPPDEVHEVLLVDDQLMVALVPLGTEEGVALMLTVGGELLTVTVALCVAVPLGPVHATV